MARAVTLLKAEARRGVSTRGALRFINRDLMESNEEGMFVTVLFGILDPSNRVFDFIRAGHNSPIFVDPMEGPSAVPTGTGQPLGVVADPLLDSGELDMRPGSLLLLYTDGLTEALDESGELFGEARTREILQTIGSSESADHVGRELHAALRVYRGEAPQEDDVTTVVIKAEQ